MELRQLEYFMTTCEELHFTRAADKLGITQPTLSHQIKALENELGVRLFDRIGKKTMITEAGMILYQQSHKAIRSLTSAREQIQELQKVERGTLSIGALPGELNELASSLLIDYHRNFPNIRIKLITNEDIVERVLQNELDFAISILPVEHDKLAVKPLYREAFFFVTTANHPLASYAQINLEELVTTPIVMFPETHRCRQLIDSTCRNAGLEIKPFIETTTIDSLFNLVRSGIGATILSKTLIEMYHYEDLLIIPIVNPKLIREVGIVYHKDKYLGQAASGFIDLIISYINSIKKEEPSAYCDQASDV
ncbi:LysR family transcriptional regulator [Paenibacillus marchantiophytorum]|uniref:LysR family transcriptional regulator n=1 Tax=Paenibacillus marchantiophytorum TaxID=1619310 RepID=A0ABQ1F2F8_9BACL|nr:LysR family transcriptional regulator [Paenibacillus marchantiophytorum]GFZ96883.1 LysR family transcriptional regulator [Paenibacillus marchantiophytorum]